MLSGVAIAVFLFGELHFLKLLQDLLVDDDVLLEDREDCVALIRTNNGLGVNIEDPFLLRDGKTDLFQFLQVDLREHSVEHARDIKLDCAVLEAILALFETQVDVLIRENLHTAQEGLVLPLLVGARRHDEARVDKFVGVLQLVNMLDGVHLLHGVQVKNHSV